MVQWHLTFSYTLDTTPQKWQTRFTFPKKGVLLEVESNRMYFEFNFIEYFDYFFTLRIESNRVRINPVLENLTQPNT